MIANGVDVQAEKKEAKRQHERAKNTILSKYLENQYLLWLITRNLKTADRIIKTIKTGFPDLLDKQLSTIHAWDIEKWRNAKAKTEMSASTINGYENTLKGAMSRAVEWDCIESHDLHKVKSLKVDNTVVRYLSENEEKQLFDTLRNRDKKGKTRA